MVSRVSSGIAEIFQSAISHLLQRDEEVQIAGEAQWVEGAEMIGRGGAQGIIFVTPIRFFFVFDNDGAQRHFEIERLRIADLERSWIVIPRFSQLKFAYLSDDMSWQIASFYCTTRLAKELVKSTPEASRISVAASVIARQNQAGLSSIRNMGHMAGVMLSLSQPIPRQVLVTMDEESFTVTSGSDEAATVSKSRFLFDDVKAYREFTDVLSYSENTSEFYAMMRPEISAALGDRCRNAVSLFFGDLLETCIFVGFPEMDDAHAYFLWKTRSNPGETGSSIENAMANVFRNIFAETLGASTKQKKLRFFDIPRSLSQSEKLELELKIQEEAIRQGDKSAISNWAVCAIEDGSGEVVDVLLAMTSEWLLFILSPGSKLAEQLPLGIPLGNLIDWKWDALLGSAQGLLQVLAAKNVDDISTCDLNEVISDRSRYWHIKILVWGSRAQIEFRDALAEAIDDRGCFDPKSRPVHPLRG